MFLERFAPIWLNILRIMTGFLFFQHGAAKLFGWFGETPVEFPELRFYAGIIEFVGGILIALGLGTRPVAFICSGHMAFAYFLSHAPQGFFPYENQGTLAALYCFVFLYMFLRGGGDFSLDGLRRSRRGAEVPGTSA